MKFIVMTNPAIDNNFVKELLISSLIPEMIVTDSPFYCKETNKIKFLFKKFRLVIKYLINRDLITRKYQPYFLAKRYGIPIWDSDNVNTDKFRDILKRLEVDYAFIFTFKIIEKKIIEAVKYGCVNFHPAFLPFNRGASPINWVILKNKKKTGITFHFINEGIDKGDIIEQYEIPLSGYENAKILSEYLLSIGAILFIQLIFKIKNGIEMNLIKNEVVRGSYEPAFRKKNYNISENMSLKEIGLIVRASRQNYNSAIYNYNGNGYRVVNFIDITNSNITIKKYPFIGNDGNVYVKSSDNKIVMLLINKESFRLKL